MTIEPVVVKLRSSLATMSAGSKAGFLAAFADVHMKWHMSEMTGGIGKLNAAPIGFLSFHHEVLSVYQARFAAGLVPGPMANTVPSFRPVIMTATKAETFSHSLEDWHNSVHRNTKKYGADFSDPVKNIRMLRFWQFHKFIDMQFAAWLKDSGSVYDDIDHTVV